jgi:hypothetical protein
MFDVPGIATWEQKIEHLCESEENGLSQNTK